ncbi:phospholipase A2 inhibitor and Ly6/PLAUR domain-containing protein-like [Protopterus annectens]|uniref:phospholipase A2 inhibitor and Ly6/PLAUR domain-containing protein-like n=1 Tax=Protopterus annectens TaxID=7888 RepID=UPI001CF97F38|nr:phospholipase A2 inhibitor and Ly6/PLAUR domain-containing protein-like [Protopterus annectens]
MYIFLPACIFCASLATGLALMCSYCPDVNSTCLSMSCTSEYPSCIAASLRMTIGSLNQDALLKLCSRSDICNKEGTANFGDVKLFGKTQCCSADLCNKDIQFSIPSMSTTPNGRSCKTCYAGSASDCEKNSVNKQCTGNQDWCLTASGKIGTGSFYISGCSSRDFCDAAVQQALSYISINIENAQCSGVMDTYRSSITHSTMILLASATMFAIKVFF